MEGKCSRKKLISSLDERLAIMMAYTVQVTVKGALGRKSENINNGMEEKTRSQAYELRDNWVTKEDK